MFNFFKNKTVIALEQYHDFSGMPLPSHDKLYKHWLISNFVTHVLTLMESQCAPISHDKLRYFSLIGYLYCTELVEKTKLPEAASLPVVMMHLAEIPFRLVKEQLVSKGVEAYAEALGIAMGHLASRAKSDAAELRAENPQHYKDLVDGLDIVLFSHENAKFRVMGALCDLINHSCD